jgi:CheY-like chemotaxis protein
MTKSMSQRVKRDFSLKFRLYGAVFIALGSIAGMLFLARFGLETLSSLRGFIGADILYSNGADDAVARLRSYLRTRDSREYRDFLRAIKVPLGDGAARVELLSPNPNLAIASQGFLDGGSHPDEVAGMVGVLQTFRRFEGVQRAIDAWTQADALVAEIAMLGTEAEQAVSEENLQQATIDKILERIGPIADGLHSLENEFSAALGEVSRRAKGLFVWAMFTFSAIEGTICLLIIVLGGRVLSNFKRASEELREQNTIKTGHEVLNEKMRGDQTVEELAANVIGMLSEYLKAQVGALYLLKDDKTLHLAGSYAYQRRKGAPNVWKPGEGLVGQAALEKKPIVMTDCPDDYVSIRSGLGSAAPKSIVAYPILLNAKLEGVIELGAFREFADKDLSFLAQAAANVAIVLQSAASRDQMVKLLEQTQQQSEELQVQQEELRQSNEELEEQTKALRESEKLLRTQQEEMEGVNLQLQDRSSDMRKQRDEIAKMNQDIQHANQLLEIKAKELESTSAYKSEFLANMSHELRTPLNSLLILSSLLTANKEGNLTEKQLQFSRTIHTSATELLNMINDILDLAKVEAGRLDLNLEEFELSGIVAEIKAKLEPLAEKKGLEFKVQVEKQTVARITSDHQLLTQIVTNLLSNAIKFTESGHVALIIRNATREDLQLADLPIKDGDGYIACCVSDTGIGIPADKQRLVFEAFQQADGSIRRKFGGSGLGLSISRQLAKLLGGEIRLESEPGKGSTFTLVTPTVSIAKKKEAPAAPAQAPAQAVQTPADAAPSPIAATPVVAAKVEAETAPPAGASKKPAKPPQSQEAPAPAISAPAGVEDIRDDRREIAEGDQSVLIVDDDPAFTRTLMELAHERGFKALVAWEGMAALHLADLYRPSGILLDLSLPGGMDGLTILGKLKENLNTRHIPVHIISGHEKSQESLRMGAVGFLRKPVSLDQLNGVFGRVHSLNAKQVKRLLVIEDNDVQSNSLKELLADEHLEVLTASSAQAALKIIGQGGVDCIVLDLGLPDMSGIELLKELRLSDVEPYIPVIVFSGKELTPEERVMLDKYAERVMVKDVRSTERLLDETALFLHRVERDLPEAKRRVVRMLHDKEAVFDGRKVLVVDDDMRNVFALTSALEEKGLELRVASNGQECLDALEKEPDVDLVLMDIMMPVMDGYEAMRRIRAQKQFAKLPIITLTAKAMKGDRATCIEAGASDYLSKPVDIAKLQSMLQVWLYQ